MTAFTYEALGRIAWRIPFFVVLSVGLWICFKNKQQNPTLSKLVGLAFLLFAVHEIFGILNRAWFYYWAQSHGIQFLVSSANTYGVISAFLVVLDLAAWSVLLFAIHWAFQASNSDSPSVA